MKRSKAISITMIPFKVVTELSLSESKTRPVVHEGFVVGFVISIRGDFLIFTPNYLFSLNWGVYTYCWFMSVLCVHPGRTLNLFSKGTCLARSPSKSTHGLTKERGLNTECFVWKWAGESRLIPKERLGFLCIEWRVEFSFYLPSKNLSINNKIINTF